MKTHSSFKARDSATRRARETSEAVTPYKLDISVETLYVSEVYASVSMSRMLRGQATLQRIIGKPSIPKRPGNAQQNNKATAANNPPPKEEELRPATGESEQRDDAAEKELPPGHVLCPVCGRTLKGDDAHINLHLGKFPMQSLGTGVQALPGLMFAETSLTALALLQTSAWQSKPSAEETARRPFHNLCGQQRNASRASEQGSSLLARLLSPLQQPREDQAHVGRQRGRLLAACWKPQGPGLYTFFCCSASALYLNACLVECCM